MSSDKVTPRRVEIFPNGEIGISWSDGRENYHQPRDLRLACPCASCVDEMTGKRVLDPARVDGAVTIEGWEEVGRYALAFRFGDGHRTGLFNFEYLRELGAR